MGAMTAAALFAAGAAAAAPPALIAHGQATQLVVGGHPWLVLGGELGNSSASSADYMAPHWARLRAMHLNTVVTPVSWELIEPAEGRYDWTNVDSLIREARAHDLKLVLLWFGAWKNSMSSYAPGWVKRDQTRFPRVQLANGQGEEILSDFAPAVLAADQRAFAALMAHLKAVDGERNTVLMVQVENEIGMLPTARDYSPAATTAFQAPVPDALVRYLVSRRASLEPELKTLWEEHGAKTSGDWRALFGEGDAAAEIFTAWHYARYADQVAAAGKAAYPIPMYVNAALNRPGKAPGEYPSGGPLPHLLDVWKAGAPHLDLLAPDIYFPNFVDLARRFRRPDNALFIPEAHNAGEPEAPANAFFAFGELDAVGYSPFSIESIDEGGPAAGGLPQAYAVLEQLAPQILAAQGSDRMAGFRPRVLFDGTVIDEPVTRRIGGYRFTVGFVDPAAPKSAQATAAHGGLIIQTGPEDYLVAGQGVTVTVEPVGDGPPIAGFDSVWEGAFDAQGQWRPGRLLNGDQTHQGRRLRLPPSEAQIQKVRLYRYR
jgi:beta-galactosidase GanA